LLKSRLAIRTGWSPIGRPSHDRAVWWPVPDPGRHRRTIEGGPEPKRVVILEFPDIAALKRWYDSPEYQKILPIRLANSTGRAFIVEGAT
jgi:hypothetical protein